jgi:hypothetical protein
LKSISCSLLDWSFTWGSNVWCPLKCTLHTRPINLVDTRKGEERYDTKGCVSLSWALLKRPPVVKPLDCFPVFYGAQRFITAFTRAIHFSLSWGRPIQSTPPFPPLHDPS